MPLAVHREIERKYDVSQDAELPPLGELPSVASVPAPAELSLGAVYFDTPDLALARAGISLRRRTGGDDAGWHLKRPLGNGDREESRHPLGRATRSVPAALRNQVRVHTRAQILKPVASIDTRRTVHRLLDPAGAVLAEVCDDSVSARSIAPGGAATVTGWREWEVELAEGSRDLLDVIEAELRQAGAAPAAGPSKLARVLESRLPGEEHAVRTVPSRRGPAAAVLHTHLHNEIAELKLRDPQVRQDKPDSVHKMRVATRRLRSTLATFRPLVDREITDPLRQELKWLAGILGDARDAEVMRARLALMIAEQPSELVIGPVARRVDKEMRAAYRTAHARVVDALDSARYFDLLDGLDALDTAPPWTASAEEPAGEVLPVRVRRDWKRLRKQADSIDAAMPLERDHQLHELRKAAKRVRYAAEALESVFGQDAKALAKAAKNMQEPLGDHQDSVVLRELLRQLGVRAHLDGENAFTYGRLHALEEARARDTEKQAAVAWKSSSDKRLRRWLRT